MGKRMPAGKTAARNKIRGQLTRQVCRLYLTHPGVGTDDPGEDRAVVAGRNLGANCFIIMRYISRKNRRNVI